LLLFVYEIPKSLEIRGGVDDDASLDDSRTNNRGIDLAIAVQRLILFWVDYFDPLMANSDA
jgi:hypothetical protein